MSVRGGAWDPKNPTETIPAGLVRSIQKRNARRGTSRAADSQRELEKLCTEHNERYKIVARHPVRGEVIAEELDELILRELSPEVRLLATSAMQLSPEQRVELLGAFTKAGALKNPFPKP